MIEYAIAAVCGIPITCAVVKLARRQVQLRQRGWTIIGQGRDQIAYVERNKGKLIFNAELMGTGPVDRVIHIPTSSWNTQFPTWAQDRREEIVSRLKMTLPELRHEYREEN